IHTLGDIFRQSLALNYQTTLAGSQRYKNYFRQMPKTKFQYKLDAKPGKDIVLSLDVLYRTATMWKEFTAIEGNHYRLPGGIPVPHSEGTFHVRTPSNFNATLSVQKWFWDRHISAQASVRNLFNDQIRMHPLGNTF